VTHVIVDGVISSEGKPADASSEIIGSIREHHDGLIVTDEIGMLGLRNFYDDADQMYLDLFNAGNDVIIFFGTPKQIYHMISVIEDAVKKGDISEERIDRSFRRIMTAKGITVV
ncbi:MAG: glycoside hydrolase family 3 N-terminal domain-containing protein, partial [Nanoarchaeota archaeon]